MDSDWEEESAPRRARKPPQYSLRTLMTVVTAAAIFFSLIAWWGLYPFVLIFSSIFSIALGTFLGLLLCSYIGLGFEFGNLRWDIAKCLVVACAPIAPIYLMALLQIPLIPLFLAAYALVAALCYWFVMKLAWDDLGSLAIFISVIISFFTWIFALFLTHIVLMIFVA